MTNINLINDQASTLLGVEVSVAPDGIGFDIYDVDTGLWLDSIEDLDEAQSYLNGYFEGTEYEELT